MNKSSRAIQLTLFTTLVLAFTWFIHTTSARFENTPLEAPQGDARADLPPAGAVQMGALPLYLERTVPASAGAAAAATTVTAWAQTLALPLAEQLSPAQFAFELALTAPDTASAEALPLQLVVDYSQIPLDYGGSFADRLTLYRVSDCALLDSSGQAPAAPSREEPPQAALHCAEWEPLAVRNDRAGRRLVAELTLPLWALPAATDAAATDAAATDAAPAAALASIAELAGGPSYYVLSTLAAGVQGDYSYTPMANVSDYQVDLNSGAMTTGYTIPVPPPRGGDAPEVSLTYNSGSIDGMHSSRNNQPGTVGIGWSLQSGAIIRHLKPCNVPQAPGDLCLNGDNYSIVLNGVSSRLVKESGNRYRLQNDPHWLVEKFTDGAAGHPDAQKEYWLVTTPDGVRYRFGGEFVPETNADQNSVFYVTIYDTNPASCGNFLYDLCDKAWQWNLDRIEDTNGNVSNYFYELETNYYKARNDSRQAFRKLYVRAGQLARIEYTTAAGQVEQPHARVLFNLELRCTNPTAGGACSWPTDFPDTPGDLQCNAYPASCSQNRPTFWSQRRTGSIQTQIYDEPAGRWEMVAHYNLEQGFPETPLDGQGDSSERKLWLGSIAQHPGGDFSHWAFIQLEAENYNVQSGIATEPALDVGQSRNITSADDGDYIVFEQVNFDNVATDLAARVASIYSGRSIEFRLDSPSGTLVATVNVPNTGGWQSWTTVSTPVSGASGVHDLYLLFKNSGMNINWFRFSPHFSSGGPLPGLPAVQYEYEMLPNRRSYDVSGVSPMYMPRIDQITTELGGVVGVTYGQSHPCPVIPSSTIRMPYDCFAAWDSGDPNVTSDDGWVLWHKWKVTQTQLSDPFSGNPAQTTSYSYSTPTWHYSDDPTLPEVNACGTSPVSRSIGTTSAAVKWSRSATAAARRANIASTSAWTATGWVSVAVLSRR